MLQGFSSATGRPSAAEPPCRKDWPSGGICAFRRRLQDPGVTQVMRLPVLFAFPGILFSLSFVGDVPSPRGTAIVPIAMGQPLVFPVLASLFSRPWTFSATGLSPGPCGLLCSFPEAFLRHRKLHLLSPQAPFLALENPFVGHCEGFLFRHRGSFFCQCTPFFLVTASSFPYHRKFPSLPPRVLSPVTASSLPRHCEPFSRHCERSEAVSYFHRVGKETASETTRRPRRDTKRGHCERSEAVSYFHSIPPG
jgi:hypothetical protein